MIMGRVVKVSALAATEIADLQSILAPYRCARGPEDTLLPDPKIVSWKSNGRLLRCTTV